MKVVVTGASGFLGKQVVKDLKKISSIELISLTRNKNADFYTDYSLNSLNRWFENADVVVHLAAKRGRGVTFEDYNENVLLSEKVVIASKENSIGKFIYISSISAYSDSNLLPWRENDSPSPCSFYGLSKVVGEEICRLHLNSTETSLYILRLAHVFGPNEKNNYMINLFIRQALNKQELSLTNLTEDKREFIYIKDVIKAIRMTIFHDDGDDGYYLLNIGAENILTNLEVGKLVNKVFDNEKLLVLGDISKNSSNSSFMNHSLAKSTIDYSASYSMEKALEEIKQEMEGVEKNVPIFY
ncbi:hypothetical protein ATZ33_09720 [Enterococcus silesiacus]|uniref:NAD-dependent epimerase/dehydratase domain-containing protein n=1 Tax=Enterococcus silesiacus TaxID=332949 RepID=A0ABM5W9K4_9ENTE|nr:hypothetical protein ATZ33_09720 [Enterococcus silesiacus]